MAAFKELRGPRLGDSASLWNFTPSPGWTKDQVAILRLALMHYGVGRWVQILDTGLLPGKLIQQLNGQTQRLLGQQSLAAYTGLHVDIDRIRADNEANKSALRKSGLIIWEGPNPTKQMKADWQNEAQTKYGLTAEQKLEAASALEQIAARTDTESHSILPLVDIMGMPLEGLTKEQKIELLKRLRRKLQSLCSSLEAPELAMGTNMSCAEATGGANTLAEGIRLQKVVRKRRPPTQRRTLPRPESASDRYCRKSSRKRKGRVEDNDLDTTSYDEHCGEVDDSDVTAAKVATREADIEQLQGMGFSKAKALEAMDECGDSVELSLEWLLTSCV